MPVIPATWEAEIERIMVQGQPRGEKTFIRPHRSGKGWVWWHSLITPGVAESLKWKDHDPGQPGKKGRPYLQNNKSKKGLEAWHKS
jgi:hypothetical protein